MRLRWNSIQMLSIDATDTRQPTGRRSLARDDRSVKAAPTGANPIGPVGAARIPDDTCPAIGGCRLVRIVSRVPKAVGSAVSRCVGPEIPVASTAWACSKIRACS